MPTESDILQPTFSPPRKFTQAEHETWGSIMRVHRARRAGQMHPIFLDGLKLLEMDKDEIPELAIVNQRLKQMSGWEGVFVKGFEDGRSFYPLLKQRKFPIGNFIRSSLDLSYTPEPDIVHDFYGHIPFLANKEYADNCQKLGEIACEFIHDKDKFRQCERVFWYGFEFALVKTTEGKRIFGAGIASSIGECEYALSDNPKIIPFDINIMRKTEFRIDEMQSQLFLLESPKQFYASLATLKQLINL